MRGCFKTAFSQDVPFLARSRIYSACIPCCLCRRLLPQGIVAMPNVVCTWDKDVEPPVPPSVPGAPWGWRCTVTPIFSMETLGGLPELKEELETFRELYGGGDAKHDLALARFVSVSCSRHICAVCTWSFTTCFRAGD